MQFCTKKEGNQEKRRRGHILSQHTRIPNNILRSDVTRWNSYHHQPFIHHGGTHSAID